jgi:hypothetical protein
MGRESIYWLIVLSTFLYSVYKNRNSLTKFLIIICFYSGLASFSGKAIENPYKIVVVIISMYLLLKNNGLAGLKKRESLLLFIFILFSFSFFFSALVNEDYFNLVFSQYGKYVTPICLFFVFKHIQTKNPGNFIILKDLLFSLLSIQIILSAIKLLTHGLQESPVGSISYIGGGPAAMLPVLGFILMWVDKRGDIKRKDWRYIILLLFIAFASLKRAIWFIMPSIIFMFIYYVPGKVKVSKLLYFTPLIPLIFYVGVRLSPTLNKESKIGGSFDLQYVLDYTQNYNFGKTSKTNEIQLGTGRGGATFLLLGKLFNSQSLSFEDYWGYGLKEVYTTDYDQFDDKKYGVNSKGAVTGIFQSYIASGYVGVMLTIVLIISVLGLIIEPRIRISIALIMFWDYLFYSGLILRSQPLFIMLFFIILYSNQQFRNAGFKNPLNGQIYKA